MNAGNPDSKGWRIGERGPVWITAIATLITALAAAGFFAGRATAPGTGSNTPVSASSPTDAPAAGASTGPISTSAAAPSTGSSPGKPVNGTQLASYSVDLSAGYAVDLGATPPTQTNFYSTYGQGDIRYPSYSNRLELMDSSDRIVSLPQAATPTYAACKASTVFVSTVSIDRGTAFCIIEPRQVVGVIVASHDSQTDYLSLNVTVWRSP